MASRTEWERFFEKIGAEVVDGNCTITDIAEAIPLTVHDVLNKLEAVRKKGSTWMARCPAHEDREPSLSIKQGEDGKTILHCFGGCEAEAVVSALGLKMSDLFPDNGRHSAPRRGGQLIPDKGRNQNSGHGKVVEAMGKLEATYAYQDEQGEVIFAVDMYRNSDASKNPVVKRPDGKGGWKYGINDKETGKPLVGLVLYNLPAVLSANTIFIVEGEKCAERLQRILPNGEAATTNPFGANRWHDKYSNLLSGKDVIILPDNDEVGKRHGKKVANSAYRYAKSLKVVELPALPKKGDIVDFLDAGHCYNDIAIQVQETENWQPDEKRHLKTVTLSEARESYAGSITQKIPREKATTLNLEGWLEAKIEYPGEDIVKHVMTLGQMEYEGTRVKVAKKLDYRVTKLDEWYEKRNSAKAREGMLAPTAWPEPVTLGEIANEVSTTLRRYFVLPEECAVAVTLWGCASSGYMIALMSSPIFFFRHRRRDVARRGFSV